MDTKQEPVAWQIQEHDGTWTDIVSIEYAAEDYLRDGTVKAIRGLVPASALASKDAEIERLQKQLGECTNALETGDKAIAENAALRKERGELQRLIYGWREYDWPEGFDRRTAQLIAENVREHMERGK